MNHSGRFLLPPPIDYYLHFRTTVLSAKRLKYPLAVLFDCIFQLSLNIKTYLKQWLIIKKLYYLFIKLFYESLSKEISIIFS